MEKMNRLLSGIVFVIVAVTVITLRPDKGPPPADAWFQKAVLESSKPVVVKFGAEWRGPCRSMDEAIKQLRPKLSSKADFFVVDIDKKPELFQHYGSGSGIPQVMIFAHGKVVSSQRGFGSVEQLESWIDHNI